MLDELVTTQAGIAAELEAFDERITERGWDFDDELSDEELCGLVLRSVRGRGRRDRFRAVTRIVALTAAEDAEIVHLMLVGTAETMQLTPDELFEHLDAIEAYRGRRSAA